MNTFEDCWSRRLSQESEKVVLTTTIDRKSIHTVGVAGKSPAIRFAGKHLSDLGFKVGGKFEITINDDGSLTIRPKNDD